MSNNISTIGIEGDSYKLPKQSFWSSALHNSMQSGVETFGIGIDINETSSPSVSKINLSEKDANLNDVTTRALNTSFGPDVKFSAWKNIGNYSARLVKILDTTIILEVLIDKENKSYQERAYRKSRFDEYELKLGKLFLIRYYERGNETSSEILDDPRLTNSDDFPKIDFSELFKNSKLFKGK